MCEKPLPAAVASAASADAAPAAAEAVTTAASSSSPDNPGSAMVIMPVALFARRGSRVSAAAAATAAVKTLPSLSWRAAGGSGTRTNAVGGRFCGSAGAAAGSIITAVAASAAAGSGFKEYRYLLLLFSPVSIARRTTKSDDSSNLSMIACAIGSVMAELSPILEATAASCLDFRH